MPISCRAVTVSSDLGSSLIIHTSTETSPPTTPSTNTSKFDKVIDVGSLPIKLLVETAVLPLTGPITINNVHDDLRGSAVPDKRLRSQKAKYHDFRPPYFSPGNLEKPYHYYNTSSVDHGRCETRVSRDEVERDGEIRLWTKKDMYQDSIKPQMFWPKEIPHHRWCRQCHDNRKGWAKIKTKTVSWEVSEGLYQYSMMSWGRRGEDDECSVCREYDRWCDDANIGWDANGNIVSLARVDTEEGEGLENPLEVGADALFSDSDFELVDEMVSEGGWEMVGSDLEVE